MTTMMYPTGSIIQLNGVKHCDIALDDHRVIGLIAFQAPNQDKVCKLFLADFRTTPLHPVTEQPPTYNLVHEPRYPISESQIKERLKKLRSKYEGSDYHVIYNNCQHFAWELITGERKSPDADKWKLIGPIVAAIRDFGSVNSSSSLVDINPLQANLSQLLMS